MNAREKRTVSRMIHIYCRSQHGGQQMLCDDCRQLEAYAHQRLEHCPFGDRKPACRQCRIHCYKSDSREKIREVMRFSGPRMLFCHPIDAVIHLWKEFRC